MSAGQWPAWLPSEDNLRILAAAREALRAGRLAQAADGFGRLRALIPQHPQALHGLGLCRLGAGQPLQALPLLKAALECNPDHGQCWVDYVRALSAAGQLQAARQMLASGSGRGLPQTACAALQRLVDGQPLPGDARELLLQDVTLSADERRQLGSLRAAGELARLEQAARGLTMRAPRDAYGWAALGQSLLAQQCPGEATVALQTALSLQDADAPSWCNLGSAWRMLGNTGAAEACLRKALQVDAGLREALAVLADVLEAQGRIAEAESGYRDLLARHADFAEGWANFGIFLLRRPRLLDAEAAFRRALELRPGSAKLHTNLGLALKEQLRADEAIAHFRRAIEIDPSYALAHSNLLINLSYDPGVSPEEYLGQARIFGAAMSRGARSLYRAWNVPRPARPLRVGLVSGDLGRHPVGYFIESLLAHLDRARIEVIAFPTSTRHDELTERIRAHVGAWIPLTGLDDDAAARQVHEARIHILIDLSGHTPHNRLPVFVRRPAPVQATWIGYFASTGLAEIDYFLADPVGVPEAQRAHFCETVWYLPDTRLCFTAPEPAPQVAPLPALKNGAVTFGCFQSVSKLSNATLAAWSRVLAALPQARLRLQAPSLADPQVRDRLLKSLAAHGIEATRVRMHEAAPRQEYLRAYSEVDMVLDTMPFPGGTTTCEALWMGVPTVTLAGRTLLARQGASLLSAAGLADWVAGDIDGYVALACRHAADLPALARLRAGLRDAVAVSPLFDAPRFAGHVMDALEAMWLRQRARAGALPTPEPAGRGPGG